MNALDREYMRVLSTPREIVLGSYVFDDVEVADNDVSTKRGLMFRQDIPDDFCMLFKFDDDAVRSFWMKNCEVPIVVVFCDRSWKILAVHRMEVKETADDSELKRYSSISPARYAIEFRDKWPEDFVLDIRVGSHAEVR